MITGYYYLHTNGSLIYKNYLDNGQEADFRESDFVVAFWPIDISNRENAWTFLVEAGAAGANLDRIKELAAKWDCNDEDVGNYLERIRLEIYKDDEWYKVYKKCGDGVDYGEYGMGNSALNALINLCKVLGYKPSKMWGHTFKSLLG